MTWFVCPHCKKPSEAEDRLMGKVIACPACGQRLQLPAASASIGSPRAQTDDDGDIPDEDEAKLRAELPDAFFSGTEKLGRPRFRVERQVLDQNAYKPAFVLLLCCIPCVLGVFAEGIYLLPRLIAILFVAGFITGAVKFIQYQRRKAKIHALVWTDGFVLFDGLQFHIWHWADITTLNMQAIDQRTLFLVVETDRLLTKYYKLRHRDGTEYRFWNTQGPRAAQFGVLVERESYRLMMPDVVQRINRGQSVPFSPFELKKEGLVYQGHFSPWSDLQPARFDRGHLCLEGVGPTAGTVRVLLQKIDNPHIFLKLLEQRLGFADDE